MEITVPKFVRFILLVLVWALTAEISILTGWSSIPIVSMFVNVFFYALVFLLVASVFMRRKSKS